MSIERNVLDGIFPRLLNILSNNRSLGQKLGGYFFVSLKYSLWQRSTREFRGKDTAAGFGRESVEEQDAPAQGHAEDRKGDEDADRRLNVAEDDVGQDLFIQYVIGVRSEELICD